MARLARTPRFLNELTVTHLEGRWWRVEEPFRYRSRILLDVVEVPPGFVTDFASVPRWPLAYWFFGSTTDEPAVIHDYLYRFPDYPRGKCDQTYLEAMEVKQYSIIRRYPMYSGVRVGGGLSYGKHEGELDPR